MNIWFPCWKRCKSNDISVGDKYRDILNRAWHELRNTLDPAKLFPDLLHSGVLNFKDIEGIRRSSKNSRVDAVDDLWQILHTKGPKAFEVFKKALQKVQPELAVHLGEWSDLYISCHMLGSVSAFGVSGLAIVKIDQSETSPQASPHNFAGWLLIGQF